MMIFNIHLLKDGNFPKKGERLKNNCLGKVLVCSCGSLRTLLEFFELFWTSFLIFWTFLDFLNFLKPFGQRVPTDLVLKVGHFGSSSVQHWVSTMKLVCGA